MIFSSIVCLVLASLAPTAFSQDIVYDSIHNATTLVGTWSSGSRAVVTGAGFANPANMTFTYPLVTGISYSFSADGFYEIARYRFNGNGSQPSCITGVLNWVHGTYTLNPNGSITTTPFGDGFQQVQDPCAAQSNFIETYNDTEYYTNWRIYQDPVQGYKFHLFQFDGSPLAPQFQVSTTPNMLPTQLLRNVTNPNGNSDGVKQQSKRSTNHAAGRQWEVGSIAGAGLVVLAVVSLGL